MHEALSNEESKKHSHSSLIWTTRTIIPSLPSMDNETKVSLKVWVDNEKKRALFGEANTDFVDILFSFMTLPLGTIVKLLSKNSGLQSIDNLYDSIEKLDDQQYWWTEACRNMLLSPHSIARVCCEDLKLKIDGDHNLRELYRCKMDSCISHSKCYVSCVRDTRCHNCGELMNEVVLLDKVKTIEDDGVFVKKNNDKFIITDNFLVKPISMSDCYDILKEFDIEDLSLIDERTLEFGREELLNLLKKLLKGKEVLTKICFSNLCIRSTTDGMKMKIFERKDNAQLETEKLQIILTMNKTNNNVVCAELRDEFANQLFSFLTFPLGSVLKFIGYSNTLGCMPNLYNSIQELKIKCFKSEKTKSMLISPQLPPFFGYKKQILDIKECFPVALEPIHECKMCKKDKTNVPLMTKCKHGVQHLGFQEINPKSPRKDNNFDRGFVREAQIFLIMDDFHITPLSVLSFNQILKKHGLKVDHVEKREMTIGRAEICALLEAMLVSKTALNDALLPYI